MNIRYWRSARWAPRRHAGQVLGKGETWGYLRISLDRVLLLRYVPWTGYEPVMVRRGGPLGEILREYPVWETREMKKRNGAEVALAGPGMTLAGPNSTVFMKLPNIMKQCSVVKYDDGDARIPGTLFVSTQGSMWKVTVTEPDVCLKLTMLAAELDDALAGIELALGSEVIPWEIDQYAMSRRPKKKK